MHEGIFPPAFGNVQYGQFYTERKISQEKYCVRQDLVLEQREQVLGQGEAICVRIGNICHGNILC